MYPLTDKLEFPHPALANDDGILAWGGDLSVDRLKLAYSYGIFPWYNPNEPIIWWSPNERFVLFPEELKVSKSMKKVLREKQFKITYNTDFTYVIHKCKSIKRENQDETWITNDMQKAYIQLHELGIAQSVEVWQENKIIGGLYGVLIGDVFCGESMFSEVSNASKAGFITFVLENNFKLIDCQVHTHHLESLGAKHISRNDFLKYLGVPLLK